MAFKIIALTIIAFLLFTDYVVLIIASRAEEKAKRMERAWKESQPNCGADMSEVRDE